MPFYEYLCGSCGKDFVLLQSITAKEEDTVCPYCEQREGKKTGIQVLFIRLRCKLQHRRPWRRLRLLTGPP